MISSFPMYDWPEVREATDALWQALSGYLPELGEIDRRTNYMEVWARQDLYFSQTCGYPFTHAFRGRLNYIATPHYETDGCERSNYCSMIFARRNGELSDFRGVRAAVNNSDSMSGMLALKLVFSPHARDGKFFGEVIESGSHVGSLLAVRDGRAEVCAIDAVCVGLARRHRPDLLEGLVEVARSPAVPGLPFVTRCGDVERMRKSLTAFFADDETTKVRQSLLLSGVTVLDAGAYDVILRLEEMMERGGGMELI